jgi:hypothetical protein
VVENGTIYEKYSEKVCQKNLFLFKAAVIEAKSKIFDKRSEKNIFGGRSREQEGR